MGYGIDHDKPGLLVVEDDPELLLPVPERFLCSFSFRDVFGYAQQEFRSPIAPPGCRLSGYEAAAGLFLPS